MRITFPSVASVLMAASAAVVAGCSGGASPSAGVTSSLPVTPNHVLSRPAAPGQAHVAHYYLVTLGTLGGGASVANSINDRGWIGGISQITGNTAVHATLWITRRKINLGTLGGPASGIGWPVKNDRGELAGISDLSQTDPSAENFCGFGSPNLCAGFTWRNHVLTALPALGGNNSFAAGVNQSGRVVGFAENGVMDSACAAPQVFDYFAAIWKSNGRPHALLPISGDSISQAVAINNAGVAAGASGPCGPPNNVGYGTAHAVLWAANGTPTDLGNLGGTTANLATAVNDRGDVVGQSALTGNPTYHAVAWHHGVITDIGTLPGDALSEALGLNNRGQAVGFSCDSSGNCRGFIWQNGGIYDLNLLVPRSPWDVVYAGDINDRGWIAGQAVNPKTGHVSAVLLIPGNPGAGTQPGSETFVLPQRVRQQLLTRHGFRIFIH